MFVSFVPNVTTATAVAKRFSFFSVARFDLVCRSSFSGQIIHFQMVCWLISVQLNHVEEKKNHKLKKLKKLSFLDHVKFCYWWNTACDEISTNRSNFRRTLDDFFSGLWFYEIENRKMLTDISDTLMSSELSFDSKALRASDERYLCWIWILILRRQKLIHFHSHAEMHIGSFKNRFEHRSIRS